jgi:hypothetical protein
MKINEIKRSADLNQFVRELYETHVTALHGIMDSVPEAVRGKFKELHDSMNASLKALPPMEQVPAAQEAGWALQTFANAMGQLADLADVVLSLKNELALKATALNGLETQIAGGDFVSKDKVKELCDLAREEGKKAVLPQVVAMRKQAVELAGLPMPADEVLSLGADQFDGRLTTAKENVAKLAAKGMKLGGKGEGWVKQTAWLAATEFAGQMSLIEDVLPVAKEGQPPRVDPLLGTPPQQESQGTAAPAITLA